MTASSRVASLAQPGGPGIAVPLGLRAAARIQERDWDEFLTNPTQLANGCRDLVDAVAPDAIVVTSTEVLLIQSEEHGSLERSPHLGAAVEAAERLVQSIGGRVAVAVSLPGPVLLSRSTGAGAEAAAEEVLHAAQAFLAAGVDLILVEEPEPDHAVSVSTLANVARFHQAHVVVIGPAWSGLAPAGVAGVDGLDAAGAASGVVVTAGELPRDVDLGALDEWVAGVQG